MRTYLLINESMCPFELIDRGEFMRARIYWGKRYAIPFVILAMMLFSSMGFSKELSNRLGVGYANQFSTDMPSLAVRYYPDPKLGVGAELGIDTNEGSSKFGFLAKIYRVIFTEDNLNFYMGTGAGIISIEENNKSNSGFEITGFCGAEFFFTGLENLGFSFEAGVGVTSIKSAVRFRTIGDDPIKAGLTFYF
jgi:hypothetical protein